MPDLRILLDETPVEVRVEPSAAETLRQAGLSAASATAAAASAADAAATAATIGRIGLTADNSYAGADALSAVTTGQYNGAWGQQALANVTSGNQNVGVGDFTLQAVATGSFNTGLGQGALSQVTASGNTAVGRGAGSAITSGSDNIFIGYSAGSNQVSTQLATATNSIAIGYGAVTTKSNQVVIGNGSTTETVFRGEVRGGRTIGAVRIFDNYEAGPNRNNIFMGGGGPTDITTYAGTGALAIGPGALGDSTTGGNLIAIGIKALRLGAGNDHTAIGNSALENCSGAGTVGNTAVGRRALGKFTSGAASTAVGDTAGYETTTGNNIDAFGYGAVWQNTTGNYICGFGAYAGAYRQQSNRWVAIGHNAMSRASTAAVDGVGTVDDNVAVGFFSLFETMGKESVAVGSEALRNHVGATGQFVAVGFRAGQRITGGGTCTFVGYKAGENASQKVDAVNSTAIGANAYTDKDNQVSIGDTNVTEVRLAGVAFTKAQLEALLALVA